MTYGWAVLGLVLIIAIPALAGLVWWIAVQSRRSYVCPACGNSITVEHMQASNCNICGAELREVLN